MEMLSIPQYCVVLGRIRIAGGYLAGNRLFSAEVIVPAGNKYFAL